jgi:CAAX protease family protein
MNTATRISPPAAVPGSLREQMSRHPLLSFFVMSYAFSWIALIPYVLSVWGVLKGDFSLMYALKPFVGPTLAAIIMTGIVEGKDGVRRLRHRLVQWRAPWPWYLFALVAVPALLLLGLVIQPGILASFQGLTPSVGVAYPIAFVVVFLVVALPEEIGWRGFALPRMQLRFGPLQGTLLLGVLWSFWHLLFFLTPGHGGGPGTNLGSVAASFGYFFVMVMALAIIFTWVFNHTGGSLFIANLLHAAIDTPQLVWIPLFLAVDETRLNLAVVIAFGVPALVILLLTHGRLGYRPDSGPSPLGS